MRKILIAGYAVMAIAAAGSAGALINTAKRSVPGASIGRHSMPHRVEHHVSRGPVHKKPVVPPSPW